ncbi:Type I Iterative PKS [Pyricularia oryzae]|uniref:Type I Iterative PKS n=1 Tax=Pyricularia grisea TaxID=148305 RepID=A0ABQ8NWU8_PYRGI|nr:Type I Iterative PKS [Pyricularia oryzae]KAI6302329.1 Type I Iterative PKS [Pyricularia grisea]KAI6287358.1 Type I Iterative PKS [Pyricularia oryzae]KAI6349856.1 Type I Iterative PKS [Pyricularia oryzae]KAI6372606.1 Type I Iterative PKS [Pyricularia oryzae]
MSSTSPKAPSAPSTAFFCPVPRLVDTAYLTEIRRQFTAKPFLKPLIGAIKETRAIWDLLARDKRAQHVASGPRGDKFAKGLAKWMTEGETGPIASQPSTIVSFPLLFLTGLSQWCSYLDLSGQTHSEAIKGLAAGGIQGYCGGMLSTVAVASASNEEELGRNAENMYRVAFLLGVFMSEGEDGPPEHAPDMMIVRLKYPGQDLALLEQFPGVYASATTNPLTICFAGKKSELMRLKEYATSKQMFSMQTYPTGTGHDPKNKCYLDGMLAILAENKGFSMPGADALRVPVQSSWDGEQLLGQTPRELARNVLGNILCGRCEWYKVVEAVAQRIRGTPSHSFLLLGGYDCVPVEPFHQASLKISKIDLAQTLGELAGKKAELASYGDDTVVIVGSACRLPGATNLDELWGVLESGVSKCEEVRPDRVPISHSYRANLDPKFTSGRKWFANLVDGADQFDNELFGISRSEATWMDPQQRVLLELAFEALDSYGHLGHRSYSREAGENVGCFIGGTLLEYNEHTSTHAPTSYSAIGTMQAFQCGRISHHFGWYGPSETIDTACSSSLVAISRAVSAVRSGECSMAVAGSANILGGLNYYLDLGKARFLSPTGQCKAFDAAADGYCRADGAGVVVLKRLKDALESGDEILAVIPAAGTNQGGLSKSITLPDPRAQQQLYRRVVNSAGLQPKDISYIECHGTGTQAGDPNEINGLRSLFGDGHREKKLYIGSVKGNIGHAEAAAGVTGLMKVLAMLRQSKIPPQASLENINPKIGNLEPFNMAIPCGTVQPWDAPDNIRRAMVNSYGAAGSNASLVVCQSPSAQPKSAWWVPDQKKKNENENDNAAALTTWPVVVSAATQASLEANCRALANMIRLEKPDMNRLLWTLSEKRQRHRFRVVLPATSNQDSDTLAVALEEASSSPAHSTPKKQQPVVLVFGGQSQRSIHLDRHLFDTTPRLRHHLAECDATLEELGYPRITGDILNHAKVDQDVLLLQTATFAVQYSCAKTWEDAGLRIDAVVGHSFGELTALAFSGAVSLRDGIRVVAERALLMQNAWGQEKGKMLAVHTAVETVQKMVDAVPGLEIACYNSPAGQVVVGSGKEIQAVEAVIAERFKGTKCQHVDVTHGFHSKFVDDILPGLDKVDKSLEFAEPRIRIELCVDNSHLGKLSPGHIGRHARNPVFFTDAIRRIAQDLGPCVWLEAGTDSPIIPMTKRAVPDPGAHTFLAVSFKSSRRPETVMSEVTMSLWRSGVDTTYWPWVGVTGIKPVRLPVYQFTRESFWANFVDHPAELKGRLEEALQQQQQQQQPSLHGTENAARLSHQKLVAQSPTQSNRFIINPDCSRFQELVRGHAVCDQAMCPASVYMECVAMAVKIHESIAQRVFPGPSMALNFANLAFSHPLTLSPDAQVSLLLDPEPGSNDPSWTFCIESARKGQPDLPIVHVRGAVSLVPSPDLRHLKALVGSRASELKAHPDAETIQSRRVYALFSRVVDYSPVLCGIQTMTMQGKWAMGTIRAPKHLVGLEETDISVLDLADAVVADNFVQVLGLAINSSEHATPGSAFIVSSIDSFTLSPACRLMDRNSTWTVTSHYDLESNSKTVAGEIYVTNEAGDVVASVLGVRFAPVQLGSLRQALVSSVASRQNNSISLTDTTAPVREAVAGPRTESIVPEMTVAPAPKYKPPPPKSAQEPPATANSAAGHITSTAEQVRSTVAKFTGATAGDMAPELTLAELGIDSLAVVEFADEFHKLFQKHFATDHLSNMSLQALIDACSDCKVPNSPSECATASTTATGDSFDFIANAELVLESGVGGVRV